MALAGDDDDDDITTTDPREQQPVSMLTMSSVDDEGFRSVFSPTGKKSSKKKLTQKSSSSPSTSTGSIGDPKDEKKKKKKKKNDDGPLLENQDEDDDRSIASQSHRMSRSVAVSKAPETPKQSKGTKSKKKKDDDDAGSTTGSVGLAREDDDASLKSARKSKRGKRTIAVDGEEGGEVSRRSRRTRSTRGKRSVSSRGLVSGSDEGGGEEDNDISNLKTPRKSSRGERSIHRVKSNKSRGDDQYPLLSPTQRSPHVTVGNDTDEDDKNDAINLKADNKDLLAETVVLRQQLQEALAMETAEMTQLRLEVQRYQKENSDLRTELVELEGFIEEKDELITTLTEAVDVQMEKVEVLELQLQRAEQEFCVMEDELKELQDQNAILRPSIGNDGNDENDESESSMGILPLRGVHHRTNNDSSQSSFDGELLRRDLLERSQLEPGDDDKMDEILRREIRLRQREKELLDLEERLNMREAAQVEFDHDDVGQKKTQGFSKTVPTSSSRVRDYDADDEEHEISRLKWKVTTLETRVAELESELDGEGDASIIIANLKERLEGSGKEISRMQEKNNSLQQAYLKKMDQEKANQIEHELQIKTIQDGNNTLIQEMYHDNRSLQTQITILQEQNENLKQLIPEEGIDPRDHAMAGLQNEIAGLLEKIVEKELEVKMRNDKVSRLETEIEERDNDIKEIKLELSALNDQVKDIKATTSKKMTQKDETIAFMQNEMVQIMKEKSQVQQQQQVITVAKERTPEWGGMMSGFSMRQERTPSFTGTKHERTSQDEEDEIARVQAFNKLISQLDQDNQKIQEELKRARYKHTIELKEKDARILEIEEELADLNYEMKARKEADYVSLLKDRKERRIELEKTKKLLKKSEDEKGDLRREIESLTQHQRDLENDVADLNKSLVSRDSGDYVSGLKRQIRSLKEHNMTLERKSEIEGAITQEIMDKQEAKIVALTNQFRDRHHPTNAVVRGMLAFAKGSAGDESIVPGSGHSARNHNSSEQEKGVEADTSNQTKKEEPVALERTSSLSFWNMLSPFGQKKNAPSNHDKKSSDSVAATNSPHTQTEDFAAAESSEEEDEEEKEGGDRIVTPNDGGVVPSENKQEDAASDDSSSEGGMGSVPAEDDDLIETDDDLEVDDNNNNNNSRRSDGSTTSSDDGTAPP